MPPLITQEEALALGGLRDRSEIEALAERGGRARVERSTPDRPLEGEEGAGLWDRAAQPRHRGRSRVPPRPDGAPSRGAPRGDPSAAGWGD